MKPTNLTFLFLLVSSLLSAQTNLDSLWNVWQDESQEDTTRLKAIDKYVWDGYIHSKPDSAFYLAQLRYDFAQSRGLKKYMAGALNAQGASYAVRGDYTKAMEYFQRFLEIMEELDDKNGIAAGLNNIAGNYGNQGENAKALDHYRRSLKLYEEIGKKSKIPMSLLNIGSIYNSQGDYRKALDYFQRGSKIYEEIGDKLGIARSLIRIGDIYNQLADTTHALDYYQRSLKTFEEIENKSGIAASLSGIGSIYQDQGNLHRALDYYRRSLAISEEIGSKDLIASSLRDIATVLQDEGDYDKALDYYRRSLTISEEIGVKGGIAAALVNIGRIYHDQANYAQALTFCQNGLELAEELKALKRQKIACQCLYDTYKAIGKGNDALMYLEKVRVLEDSLQTDETGKKLQQMEFAQQVYKDCVETYERERQVELAHLEEVRKKNQSRNWSVAGGFLALLLAGGLYSRIHYIRKSKAIIELERDRSDNLLHNILPAEVAAQLKEKGKSEAKDFENVTVLFTDFIEFTQTAAKLTAKELVSEINTCFEVFDEIITKYKLEKIKTIGDAYMAAGGLHVPRTSEPIDVVNAAIEMQAFMLQRKAEHQALGLPSFDMRLGIHTGPVVAGIVGVKKFQYDIWGDTVNTASRMESNGEVGKVNISQVTYELLKDHPEFKFYSRGKIDVKGKGEMEMWFVSLKHK